MMRREKLRERPWKLFSLIKSYTDAESNSKTMHKWSLNTKKSSILTRGLSPLGSYILFSYKKLSD